MLLGKLDSEVDKSLLFSDELLVLDPVVSRVDLANQVEPLLLLFRSDSARRDLVIEGCKLVLVLIMLGFALVFICAKRLSLPLANHFLCNLIHLLHDRHFIRRLVEAANIKSGTNVLR